MPMCDQVGDLLARVRAARQRLVEQGPPRTRDVEDDFERISLPHHQGDRLRDLLVNDGASSVVEIGLGYGSSALAIGEALLMAGSSHARHVVIDAFQSRAFEDAGWDVIRQAGMEGVTRLIVEPSQVALPRLVSEGWVADAGFVDGSHAFHNVFIDLYFLGQVVRPGGLIVVDDHDVESVATAVRYYTVNMAWCPVPVGSVDVDPYQHASGAGRERLYALRLPDPAVEPSFEDFREFAGATVGGAGRLIVVCGLPGAGKTRHATQVAATLDAVRLDADHWMTRLGLTSSVH